MSEILLKIAERCSKEIRLTNFSRIRSSTKSWHRLTTTWLEKELTVQQSFLPRTGSNSKKAAKLVNVVVPFKTVGSKEVRAVSEPVASRRIPSMHDWPEATE